MDSLLNTLGLSTDKKAKINSYIENLFKFDRSKRLIGSGDKKKWVLSHIEDSIKAFSFLKDTQSYYDMGSGNGLPGIIFSIIDETSQVTLVDNDKKKIEFLKTMVHRLDLKATVLASNIQEIDLNTVPRGTFFLYRAFSPKETAFEFIKKNNSHQHILFASVKQNSELEVKKTIKYRLSDGSYRKLLII